MKIAGIDPGTKKSGFVIYNTESRGIEYTDVLPNSVLYNAALPHESYDLLAIEAMVVYQANKSITETLFWSGRFSARADWKRVDCQLVYRPDIVKHFTGKRVLKGADGKIRQHLIDRLGEPGNKANPGKTYGVSTHAWQALAVCVALDEGVALRTNSNEFNS